MPRPRCRVRSRGSVRRARGSAHRERRRAAGPSEPASMEASSVRMSPNMFSVTITSNDRRDAAAGASRRRRRACARTPPRETRRAARRSTTARHRREVSSTLALSTETMRRRRPMARRPATRSHALDFVGGVGADVLGLVRGAALLAEVDAAGQFPHHHDVRAGEHLGLERRGVEHRLAWCAPGAGWRTRRACGAVPAGPVRGARVHRDRDHFGPPTAPSSIGRALAAGVDRAGRQCRARRVDRRAADQRLGEFEVVTVLRAHGLQHPDGLGRDLGADAVAAEDGDARLHAPSRVRS